VARVSLPQSKIRARRKKRRIVIASIAAGVLAVVVGALAWASHLSFVRIDTIEVEGNSVISKDVIAAAVNDITAGNYLYLFPKNNIFLYPKYQLEHELPKKISTLERASVRAVNFHTLKVSVHERARKALWCGTTVGASDACFWLDPNGLAYSSVGDIALTLSSASSTYQRYFGPLVGTSTPKHFLTEESFTALSALVDALAEQQKENVITSIAVDSAGVVRVNFKNDFTLIFMLKASGADVYERFTLALTADDFVQHPLSDFDYLDLRFGDKLYYKLK
jgi:hypothetical protein